jgi:hypothetical protein
MRIGAGSVRETAKAESAYVVAVTFRDGTDATYTVAARTEREAVRLAHDIANDEGRAFLRATARRDDGSLARRQRTAESQDVNEPRWPCGRRECVAHATGGDCREG